MLELCKIGLLKKNCISLKKDDSKDNTNVVTEEVHDALLLLVDSPIDSWVLDLSAWIHTTTKHDLFKDHVADNYRNLGKPLEIIMGNIQLKMSNGTFWEIHKVRYVPKLKRNLISIGQLNDEGGTMIFNGG